MEELNYIIANNIVSLRLKNGMTQLELAEKLNYSDKLISKWERGDAAPNAQTLKQISDIFSVSIDFLFTDHRDGKGNESDASKKNDALKKSASTITTRENRFLITAISIIGIWMIALLVFVIMWIVDRPIGMIFIYALPVSFITLLVLNSVWNGGRHNFFIISALIVGVIAAVYVSLLKYNCWQIFILLIPAEALVLLCTRLKRGTNDR